MLVGIRFAAGIALAPFPRQSQHHVPHSGDFAAAKPAFDAAPSRHSGVLGRHGDGAQQDSVSAFHGLGTYVVTKKKTQQKKQ